MNDKNFRTLSDLHYKLGELGKVTYPIGCIALCALACGAKYGSNVAYVVGAVALLVCLSMLYIASELSSQRNARNVCAQKLEHEIVALTEYFDQRDELFALLCQRIGHMFVPKTANTLIEELKTAFSQSRDSQQLRSNLIDFFYGK